MHREARLLFIAMQVRPGCEVSRPRILMTFHADDRCGPHNGTLATPMRFITTRITVNLYVLYVGNFLLKHLIMYDLA